jgi:hypothetical protein
MMLMADDKGTDHKIDPFNYDNKSKLFSYKVFDNFCYLFPIMPIIIALLSF